MEETSNDDWIEKNCTSLKKMYQEKLEEMLYLFEDGKKELLRFNEQINKRFTSTQAEKSFKFFTQFIDNFKKNLALWNDEICSFQEMYPLQKKDEMEESLPNDSTKNMLGNNSNANVDTSSSKDICTKSDNLFDTDVKKEIKNEKSQNSTNGAELIDDSDSNDSVFSRATQVLDKNDDNFEIIEPKTSTLDMNCMSKLEEEDILYLKKYRDKDFDEESQNSFIFDFSGYENQNDNATGEPTCHNEDNSSTNEILNIEENLSKEVQLSTDSLNNENDGSSDSKCNYVNKVEFHESEDAVSYMKSLEIKKLKFFKLLGLASKKDLIYEEVTEEDYDLKLIHSYLTSIEDAPDVMTDVYLESELEDSDEENLTELAKIETGLITNQVLSFPLDTNSDLHRSTNENSPITALEDCKTIPCAVVLQNCSRTKSVTLENKNGIESTLLNSNDKQLENQNTKSKKAKNQDQYSDAYLTDESSVSNSVDSDGSDGELLINPVLEEDYPKPLDSMELCFMGMISSEEDNTSSDEVEPASKKTRTDSTGSDKENLTKKPIKEPKEIKKTDNKLDWKSDPLLRCSLTEKKTHLENKNVDDLKEDNIPPQQLNKNVEVKIDCNDATKIESKEKLASADLNLDDNHHEVLNCDSDSDIEFISISDKSKNKRKHSESFAMEGLDDNDGCSKKKGRRNIRMILDDNILTESTKQANIVEEDRITRLSQKQKHMELIVSTQKEKADDLILDIDEKTEIPLVAVSSKLTLKLKPHQKEGVKFMWANCYESIAQIANGDLGSGCVLAHCMGLGKTLQVITLIHTLFAHESTKTQHVLIVSPLSIVLHWKKEFCEIFKILNENLFHTFYISKILNKVSVVKKWEEKKGVLVLGYECYQKLITPKDSENITAQETYLKEILCDPGPDLVILDEGHLIKNGNAVRSKALQGIKTKRRIVLTGTPLQNNLMEYYYMIRFVKPNLLGSVHEYTNRFVNPITNGQYYNSTESDIIQMKKRSHILHKLLQGTIQRYELSELCQYLPKQNDYAIFIQLHPLQMSLYDTKCELMDKDYQKVGPKKLLKQLVTTYHQCQIIWTHPYMFYAKLAHTETETTNNSDCWWKGMCPTDSDSNIDYGPKLKVMFSIIRECENIGDKVLVFSNSLIELNVIEHFLKKFSASDSQWIEGHDYLRMDGRTSSEKRIQLCNRFNNRENNQLRLFLISTKIGGLGLNLIGANRVILMDVSWNPAHDNQSVFRTYRFGQDKECFVYRLVALGTMEEVVYERQVTKLAVSGRVIDLQQISRHYNSNDLCRMYRSNFKKDQVRPTFQCTRDILLTKILSNCMEIFNYHEHQSLLQNIPAENLNEKEMQLAWKEFEEEKIKNNEIMLQKKKASSVPALNETSLPSTSVNVIKRHSLRISTSKLNLINPAFSKNNSYNECVTIDVDEVQSANLSNTSATKETTSNSEKLELVNKIKQCDNSVHKSVKTISKLIYPTDNELIKLNEKILNGTIKTRQAEILENKKAALNNAHCNNKSARTNNELINESNLNVKYPNTLTYFKRIAANKKGQLNRISSNLPTDGILRNLRTLNEKYQNSMTNIKQTEMIVQKIPSTTGNRVMNPLSGISKHINFRNNHLINNSKPILSHTAPKQNNSNQILMKSSENDNAIINVDYVNCDKKLLSTLKKNSDVTISIRKKTKNGIDPHKNVTHNDVISID